MGFNITPQEFRDWITFLFVIIGGSLALRTYIVNQRQRKLDNSLRLLERFWSAIDTEDLGSWEDIFRASSDCAGATEGNYVSASSEQSSLSSLFSEGPADQGATDRIAQELNIICQEILENTVNPRIIYHELGQLIDVIFGWLSVIDKQNHEMPNLLGDHFKAFDKVCKKYRKKFKKWYHKIIVYVE